MSIAIKRQLQARYPELADVLQRVRTVPRLTRRDMALPEALVRVITGQMLSAQAAATIYGRIEAEARRRRLKGSWLLDHEALRACGLSGGKARAVGEVASRVGRDPRALDHWYDLPADDLMAAVRELRGLGNWTASIIALFYVGHEDIFPEADGSLKRAITLIEARAGGRRRRAFDPGLAAPYRSYLAMYLWRALDDGMLDDARAAGR